MKIEIYTDGSATSLGHPGGWAFVVVVDGRKTIERYGHMESASNNDAEIEAALMGLSFLAENFEKHGQKPEDYEVELVSDSKLILGWATGEFRAKNNKTERVVRLRSLVQFLRAKTRWVRGHSGNEHNNRCDKLANNARKGLLSEIAPSNTTKIGTRQSNTMSLWYRDKLYIIDFENLIVEPYDKPSHGHRSSSLELRSKK